MTSTNTVFFRLESDDLNLQPKLKPKSLRPSFSYIVILSLIFFLFLIMLVYFWYVAREALETTGFVASGVVAFDFFLNLTIERLFGLQ